MFDLPCPKRFFRLSTALLAMVTYRCMLPLINRRAGKIIHNKTLSGGPCIRFNTVLFLYLFCIAYHVLCNPQIPSRQCRLSRTTSDPAQKSEKNQAAKIIAFFPRFSGEDFGTILSRRSRLSRTSRAPSQLIRPRPIDCDAGRDRQTKVSRFFEEEKHKKGFFSRPTSNPDLQPKRRP